MGLGPFTVQTHEIEPFTVWTPPKGGLPIGLGSFTAYAHPRGGLPIMGVGFGSFGAGFYPQYGDARIPDRLS